MSDYEIFSVLQDATSKDYRPDAETSVIFGEYLNEADQKRVLQLLKDLIKVLDTK